MPIPPDLPNDHGVDPYFEPGDISDLFADPYPGPTYYEPRPDVVEDDEPVPVYVQQPRTLKVLLPPDHVVWLGGAVDTGAVTGVPMVVLFGQVVCLLPINSTVERLTGPENPRRTWELVYAPPPGFDTTWVGLHPEWQAA